MMKGADSLLLIFDGKGRITHYPEAITTLLNIPQSSSKSFTLKNLLPHVSLSGYQFSDKPEHELHWTDITGNWLAQFFYNEGKLSSGVLQLQMNNLKTDNPIQEELQQEILKHRKTAQDLQNLAAIVRSAHVAIFTTDLDRKITFWNKGAENLLGYTKQEMLGNMLTPIFPPEEYEVAASRAKSVHEGNNLPSYYATRIRKDGTKLRVQVSLSPLQNLEGEIIGTSVMMTDVTELRAAEEQLQQMYKLVKETEEIAHLGSWEHDLKSGKVRWSEEIYRIYGLSSETTKPNMRHFRELTLPEDLPVYDATAQQIYDEHKPRSCTRRIRRPDGQVRYLLSEATPEFDEQGELIRLIGFTQDITRLKESEQELKIKNEQLKAQRQELKTTQELARLGRWSFDLCTSNLDISEEIIKIFGVRSFSRYDDLLDYVDPLNIRHLMSLFEKALMDLQPFNVECRVFQPDGTSRWLYLQGEVIADEAGNPVEIKGIAQDITERKETEEQLKESQQFIKRITEASPDYLSVIDLESKTFVFENRSFMVMLGYDPKQVTISDYFFWLSLIHPDDRQRVNIFLENFRGVKDGEIRELEYRLRLAKGRWLWVCVRNSIFKRSADGLPVQMISVVQNISYRKKVTQQLEVNNLILQSLLNHLNLFQFMIDEDGLLKQVSGAGLQKVGISAGELEGKPYQKVFEQEQSVIENAFQGQNGHCDCAYIYNSTKHLFHCFFFPHPSGKGVVGFSVNVMEQVVPE